MKRLNRKGFTLVELLAVIIILAIVVGITIPAVMSTVSNAKVKAFQTASQTCADWLQRQYDIYSVDPSDTSIDSTLKTKFDGLATTSNPVLTDNLVMACGLKTANIVAASSKFKVTNGRVCLLLAANENGDYAKVGTFTAAGAAGGKDTNYSVGGGCNNY